jgi:hypothetical protein
MIFKIEQAALYWDVEYIKDLPDEIEINTIDELLFLINKYEHDVLIHWFSNKITIGNGYLENI